MKLTHSIKTSLVVKSFLEKKPRMFLVQFWALNNYFRGVRSSVVGTCDPWGSVEPVWAWRHATFTTPRVTPEPTFTGTACLHPPFICSSRTWPSWVNAVVYPDTWPFWYAPCITVFCVFCTTNGYPTEKRKYSVEKSTHAKPRVFAILRELTKSFIDNCGLVK